MGFAAGTPQVCWSVGLSVASVQFGLALSALPVAAKYRGGPGPRSLPPVRSVVANRPGLLARRWSLRPVRLACAPGQVPEALWRLVAQLAARWPSVARIPAQCFLLGCAPRPVFSPRVCCASGAPPHPCGLRVLRRGWQPAPAGSYEVGPFGAPVPPAGFATLSSNACVCVLCVCCLGA